MGVLRQVFHAIRVEQLKCGAQWITLNLPAMRNAINDQTMNELRMAFKTIDTETVRAVVLTGAGDHFSSGVDVDWIARMRKFTREQHLKENYALFDTLLAIWNCPLPVIARVNGDAQGAGVGLVAACDMAYGVKSAQFSFPEVHIGTIPAVIAPFAISRMGPHNTNRLMLTAEKFSAPQAQQYGLLTEVSEGSAEMDASIDKILTGLENNSIGATMRCKQMLRGVCGRYQYDPTLVRDLVCASTTNVRMSTEGQEGMAAIVEGRLPQWADKKVAASR